jgi:hypothetical protein
VRRLVSFHGQIGKQWDFCSIALINGYYLPLITGASLACRQVLADDGFVAIIQGSIFMNRPAIWASMHGSA